MLINSIFKSLTFILAFTISLSLANPSHSQNNPDLNSESDVTIDIESVDSEGQNPVKEVKKITLRQIDQSNLANVAVFRGLNKITAKSSEFEVGIEDEVSFGRLTIIPHQCWQAPPDQRPESKILLEINEIGVNNVKKQIFYGWMFASSPSISGLEHPIYDITALNCLFK
ncbi:MAG: DUF2155 domain-containing protein [Proteobacteria bacterium]|nr:DUF2155 domain-containing protein [Pseudomonadota bacterium]